MNNSTVFMRDRKTIAAIRAAVDAFNVGKDISEYLKYELFTVKPVWFLPKINGIQIESNNRESIQFVREFINNLERYQSK